MIISPAVFIIIPYLPPLSMAGIFIAENIFSGKNII